MEESSKVLDNFIDKLFSLSKTTYFLAGFVILGLILRIMAAINLSVQADDMHFVTHAINFISAGRLETYDQSSGLWFAFTSIIYKILGTTQLASRFAAIFFGTATIISIYFLTKEFFSKRVALISAFLLSIATFHINSTMAEMDVMAMFFVITGMFVFIRALKSENPMLYIISGIFFGLAIYTKVYPVLFIPSLFLYAVYYWKKNNSPIFSRNKFEKIFIFCLIVLIFSLPALTHNYLLYKDKGFMDLQFSQHFDENNPISEKFYGFDPIYGENNDWRGFFLGNSIKHGGDDHSPLFILTFKFIYLTNPLILFLGLIGFLLVWMKKFKNNYGTFFILSILFALPFLGSIILLPKHYLFLEALLIPLAANLLNEVSKRIPKINNKDSIYIIASIILIYSLIFLGMPTGGTAHPIYGKSYIGGMIDFKDKNIPQDALVVVDSRIYRGQMNWMFQNRRYLDAAEFLNVINNQDKLPGNNTVQVNVYYIECVYDDCGWGTINGQPELNKTMDDFALAFQNQGSLIKTIQEPNRKQSYYPIISSNNKVDALNVYHSTFTLKNSVFNIADLPKNWFAYYIGYPEPSQEFDYYTTYSSLDSALDKIAHWVVILALILAVLSPLYPLYLLGKEENIIA
ncbi:hypothetical protein COU54_04465 [Candidatus Pacearchaeota archaeon CG10_big_fil_rev_8_21_14_0_10_31_24]|nr:MAG: hypothetical protein COU54_04465 [Candidatus Pacearchaeota archaeon CG10_big_fil_rev_8_21_14_0_10_31_24]